MMIVLLTRRRRQALLLTGTLALAVVVTAGISGWVIAADPAVGVSEALRTGGVAGASVVALYALWLNDRRRRVEEGRQAVEEERLRAERRRTSDERFARAIEMLGDESDQVRCVTCVSTVPSTSPAPLSRTSRWQGPAEVDLADTVAREGTSLQLLPGVELERAT